MNSPFAKLFLAIQERISDEVPAIRFIDQELGQLEYFLRRPAVNWPCTLIDIDVFSFQELGELGQTGEGRIVLRLGFPPFSATDNLTPLQYRQRALEFYDIEFNLIKALHGWSPQNSAVFAPAAGEEPESGGFGQMIRTSCVTERRRDPFRVRVITFSLGMEDYIALRKYIVVVGDYSKKSYNPEDYNVAPLLDISA